MMDVNKKKLTKEEKIIMNRKYGQMIKTENHKKNQDIFKENYIYDFLFITNPMSEQKNIRYIEPDDDSAIRRLQDEFGDVEFGCQRSDGKMFSSKKVF